MKTVQVTVRQKDGTVVWQQLMDHDSAYFEDFHNTVEMNLSRGCSITITPADDLNDLSKEKTASTKWA